MEKITFGDNIPGYIYGPEDAPGVVMLQVSCRRTQLRVAKETISRTAPQSEPHTHPVDVCYAGVVGLHNR